MKSGPHLDFENLLYQIHDLTIVQILFLANLQAHVASDFLAWWLGAIPDERGNNGLVFDTRSLVFDTGSLVCTNHGRPAQESRVSRRLCRVFDNISSENWTSKKSRNSWKIFLGEIWDQI